MCVLLTLAEITFKCFKPLHCQQLVFNNNRITNIKYLTKTSLNIISTNHFYLSALHLKNVEQSVKDKSTGADNVAKPEKKKKEKLNYITLIAPNKHVTVTTLEDASKLALRRDLKLIKIKDYQTSSRKDRPTYQLMTTSQYLQEEKRSKNKEPEKNKTLTKGTKLLSLSSKINDHDINAKINSIIRWLEKRNEVKVVISNDNGEAENVYNKIVDKVKDNGKFVQKREKGSEIRFHILPPKIDSPTLQEDATVITSGS